MRIKPQPSAITTGLIILVGTGFSVAMNWPGQLSYDSVIQLLEGRTGIYSDWHPPVMSWMLGLADTAISGAGLFILFNSALLAAAMVVLLVCAPRVSWLAAAVAGLCFLLPQFFTYPGTVWKDVLFAIAAVAGFSCLAFSASIWENRSGRLAWMFAAFALLVLATLTRQNGSIVLLAGALGVAVIAALLAKSKRVANFALYGTVCFAVSLVAVAAITLALDTRVAGPSGPQTQIRLLEAYDIVGAVAADPSLELREFHTVAPGLEKFTRTEGVRLYTPLRIDTLVASANFLLLLDNTEPDIVFRQWLEIVKQRPLLYLGVRLNVFSALLRTPDQEACHPYYFGVDGPYREMNRLDMKPRWNSRDNFLENYADMLVGTPAFSHLTYLIIALFSLSALIRRRRPADIAIAAMLVSAIAFALSFFVISIACDYRYLYVLDLSALVSIFYLSLDCGKDLERVVNDYCHASTR